jgi:hypothetical protein
MDHWWYGSVVSSASLLFISSPITIGGTITINSSSGFPQIDFNSDGTITYSSNGISGLYHTRGWYQAANFGHEVASIGSLYQIKLTPTSESFDTSSTGVFLGMGGGVTWRRSAGSGSSTGIIEIRDAASVVVGTCNLVLNDT